MGVGRRSPAATLRTAAPGHLKSRDAKRRGYSCGHGHLRRGPTLISRLKTEFGFARLWPWIEKSVARRFAFAAITGGCAAALHWLIFPITQSRVTFIFFIPAIVLVTTIAGRWPGVLVAIIGLTNSALMKTPGTLLIPNSAEQVALISSAVVSAMVVVVGDYYRSLSRRELADLDELPELS